MHRILLALLLAAAAPLHAETPAETAPGMTLQITPALAPRITFEPVEVTQYQDVVRLPGRVALDEHRVARIGPSISGRVVEIKAFIGRRVQKGEVLAVLNSTELSNTQAAFLKAKTQMGLQQLAVSRARRLFSEGIISEATLKEREGGLSEAEVEVRAMADQLGIMGMSNRDVEKLMKTGQINSVTPVTATISGTVIERHISIGQIAEISDELFTVADLSRVWAVAEAPEQDANVAKLGTRVEVQISALPNEHYTGKIVFVADTVAPETRTVTLRMEVENTQGRIKPGMLVDMVIKHAAEQALTVPAQAVLREGDRDCVFVETAPDRVVLRPVTLDVDRAGRRRVLAGLAAGERIVAEGAFHLNNVRNLKGLE